MTQNILKATWDSPSKSAVPEKKKKRGLAVFFLVAALLFIAVAVLGVYSRNARTTELQLRADEGARLVVRVIHPEKGSGIVLLQLPGQTTPYTDAPIFAQTSGYLKAWYFDIGAKVKAGDVLAEIDTPQVDQQLAQARAQLGVAKAARDLAQVTYNRDQQLFKTNVIAAQDFDTVASNYHGSEATVIADQAMVNRLEALEAFKNVRAPFDGIVTARNIDIGAYVPSGSGTQLFRLARISPLRVYVDTPEAFAPLVHPGDEADLAVNQFPAQKFAAHVVATSGAINPTSKRLLTELEVPNKTGELQSGAFVQITLRLQTSTAVTIPAKTLLFESGESAVGVVHPDGTVEIRKIRISRDLGRRVQVAQGLSESDQLIINPPPGLAAGAIVTIAQARPEPM
ncbi:MAG TPA: efflux RND transporter periplasmic adaptor subunit [Chthoniobacterales bacterium]